MDITAQKSQHIDEFVEIPLDYVVTVCDHAPENCPWFPAHCKVLHVGFQDPPRMAAAVKETGGSAEEQLDCYRVVRDQIRAFVETLPGVLDR